MGGSCWMPRPRRCERWRLRSGELGRGGTTRDVYDPSGCGGADPPWLRKGGIRAAWGQGNGPAKPTPAAWGRTPGARQGHKREHRRDLLSFSATGGRKAVTFELKLCTLIQDESATRTAG